MSATPAVVWPSWPREGPVHLVWYAQRIVRLDTAEPIGAELLTRPADGTPPPLLWAWARSIGAVASLEARVREAATALRERIRGCVFLNTDPDVFRADPPITDWRRLLPVVVEITERSMPPIEAVRLVAAEGIPIAIDDVGAGTADLYRLESWPAEWIKIDGGWVREATEHARSAALLAAIAEFGRRIGAGLIAEGVETEAQRRVALSAGIGYGQGYLWHRPEAVGEGDWYPVPGPPPARADARSGPGAGTP